MWNDGWHNGSGSGWLAMALMMIVFWGGLIWLVITLSRHNSGAHHPPPSPPPSSRLSPEDILHERLARGEIDTEEYRQRLEALRTHRTP